MSRLKFIITECLDILKVKTYIQFCKYFLRFVPIYIFKIQKNIPITYQLQFINNNIRKIY